MKPITLTAGDWMEVCAALRGYRSSHAIHLLNRITKSSASVVGDDVEVTIRLGLDDQALGTVLTPALRRAIIATPSEEL